MFARLGLGLRVNQSSAHDMTDEGHWNEDAFHHLAILLAGISYGAVPIVQAGFGIQFSPTMLTLAHHVDRE